MRCCNGIFRRATPGGTRGALRRLDRRCEGRCRPRSSKNSGTAGSPRFPRHGVRWRDAKKGRYLEATKTGRKRGEDDESIVGEYAGKHESEDDGLILGDYEEEEPDNEDSDDGLILDGYEEQESDNGDSDDELILDECEGEESDNEESDGPEDGWQDALAPANRGSDGWQDALAFVQHGSAEGGDGLDSDAPVSSGARRSSRLLKERRVVPQTAGSAPAANPTIPRIQPRSGFSSHSCSKRTGRSKVRSLAIGGHAGSNI